jgi:nitroreductase
MKNIIEDLNWRYATKKFDANSIISEEKINVLLESIRLTPSSYGLQPYKVIVVKNEDLRGKLVSASYGQEQVKDASHLIVFCAYNELKEEHIDQYIETIAKTRGVDSSALQGFSEMMKNTALKMPKSSQKEWMNKQAYIALGQLLLTAAQLKIDATPMEGFDASQYDDILDLKKHNLTTTLVCPIGYRSEEDSNSEMKKVRKSHSEFILEI